MKKIFAIIVLLACTAPVLLTSSCKKIKEEIISNISPFVYSSTESFEIPAPLPPTVYTTPQQSETININQIIKDNSGLNLNINNFTYIGLKDVTLHLKNGTEGNNWSNFEYIEVQANTDKGLSAGKPWLTARTNVTDTDAPYNDKVLTFAGQNIKDYINGDSTTVYYRFSANVVHVISDAMQIEATIRYEFKP